MEALPIHTKLVAAIIILFSIVACLPQAPEASDAKLVEVLKSDLSISWQEPKEYEDDSELKATDIESYIISYRHLESGVEQSIEVAGSLNTYTLKDLDLGPYAISIQSKTVFGTVSQMSNQIVKTAAI